MPDLKDFRLPSLTQRLYVVGRTGSGKTTFGAWILSHSRFDKQPYVMVDYKRDSLLGQIDATEIDVKDRLPKAPGLYVIRPKPETDDDNVDAFLTRVWERENIGLYFDELYMVPQKAPIRWVMTQGRSKHIPVIGLSQRPVYMSRFVVSEADFYSIFRLKHPDDKKVLAGFVGSELMRDEHDNLPEFHSLYYDVAQDIHFRMLPVPSEENILQRLADRLRPRQVKK